MRGFEWFWSRSRAALKVFQLFEEATLDVWGSES